MNDALIQTFEKACKKYLPKEKDPVAAYLTTLKGDEKRRLEEALQNPSVAGEKTIVKAIQVLSVRTTTKKTSPYGIYHKNEKKD